MFCLKYTVQDLFCMFAVEKSSKMLKRATKMKEIVHMDLNSVFARMGLQFVLYFRINVRLLNALWKKEPPKMKQLT